jgi:protein-S-isoprenylcysteine O-methyltransferase Ste14
MSLDTGRTGDGGLTETTDRSNAVIRPPIAWALAFATGLAINWLYPLRWVPATWPNVWIGIIIFAAGFALAIWAIVTFRRAGTRVETTKSTMTIVTDGPYRFTRNPIYLGMSLGQTDLAVAFDNLWILVMLIPFYLVLRYGVVAREEAYLERKFGEVYLDYKSRVRRWL